jgi:predicted DNA-binding transcriptional regulator YafY
MVAKKNPTLKFEYTNWEGKTAVRTVRPIELWYGKTEWHPEEQWLLRAIDLDKGEERSFAVKDIIKFL